jgi:hypothetical protein
VGNGLTGTQLMVFFLQGRINRYRLEFPNYWLILARTILLEGLLETQRKRISIRGLDLWLPSLQKTKFPRAWSLPSTPCTPCHKYATCNPKKYFILFFLLTMYCWRSTLCILCRTTNSWFHALLFPRKDPSMVKSPLLTLKPPRLVRTRMGMEPRVLWREVTPLCRLPSSSLKLKV